MDAVGDVLDGHAVQVALGPEELPHLTGHGAVQLAHAVGEAGQPQRQHRHAELLAGVGGVHQAHVDQLVHVEVHELGVGAQVLADVVAVEGVVAGGHRRVGGEDVAGAGGGAGRVQVEAVVVHQAPDLLDGQEGRVSLVEVADVRRDAHRREGPQAAHAEQDLLAYAGVLVAAVEVAGDGTVLVVVALDLGVEQVEGDAPHVDLPDLRAHRAARIGQLDQDGRPVVAALQGHGQQGEIVAAVVLALAPLEIDLLVEVAEAVGQAHAHQGEAQVAGGLEVVAREDAQPARVERQALVDAELGGEVGHTPVVELVVVGVGRGVHVGAEAVVGLAQRREVDLVGGQGAKPRLVDAGQQGQGVVAHLVPAGGVHVAEHVTRLGIPGPPEVAGQVPKGGQGFGQGEFGAEAVGDRHRDSRLIDSDGMRERWKII